MVVGNLALVAVIIQKKNNLEKNYRTLLKTNGEITKKLKKFKSKEGRSKATFFFHILFGKTTSVSARADRRKYS